MARRGDGIYLCQALRGRVTSRPPKRNSEWSVEIVLVRHPGLAGMRKKN